MMDKEFDIEAKLEKLSDLRIKQGIETMNGFAGVGNKVALRAIANKMQEEIIAYVWELEAIRDRVENLDDEALQRG